MPDDVQMCLAIPPKHPVAAVIGFLNARVPLRWLSLCGKERNLSGVRFRARGCPDFEEG